MFVMMIYSKDFLQGDLVALHGIPKNKYILKLLIIHVVLFFTDFADQYEPIGNANSGEKKSLELGRCLIG